jgi:cold shock CspA family protein
MRGRMIWFNAEKGYGFIRTEDDERLYIHESGFAPGHVPTGRCAGNEMSFDRQPADVEGGHQAVEAMVVQDVVQRRARSHRRSIG